MGYEYYGNRYPASYRSSPYSDKSKTAALLLCFFGGFLGLHQFYAGKTGKGILYLFTGGVFGIMWIVDIFRILFDKFPDSRGLYITGQNAGGSSSTSALTICLWVFVICLGIYGVNAVLNQPRGEVYTYEEYQELLKEQQNEQAAKYTVPLASTVSDTEPVDEPSLNLRTGELLSVITNERDGMKVIIVKAKIQGQLNDDLTVDQNYYNACDLITRQGCDKYDELQYWAVADMANGSEDKVIAFTLNKQTIQGIKENHILPNELTVYSDDLWIHPNLVSTTSTAKTTTASTTTSTKKQETTTVAEVPAYTTIESRETEPTLSDTQTPRNIILNTDTHCFHLSGNCSAAKRIYPENRQDEYTTIENVKARGYTACGTCAKKYKD